MAILRVKKHCSVASQMMMMIAYHSLSELSGSALVLPAVYQNLPDQSQTKQMTYHSIKGLAMPVRILIRFPRGQVEVMCPADLPQCSNCNGRCSMCSAAASAPHHLRPRATPRRRRGRGPERPVIMSLRFQSARKGIETCSDRKNPAIFHVSSSYASSNNLVGSGSVSGEIIPSVSLDGRKIVMV